MKQIVNLKRIFINEDFDELVLLLNSIKEDHDYQLLATDKQGSPHFEMLQIIAHRLYTHPQNPTLNVLEVDYVNKVENSTITDEACSQDILPEPSSDSESEVHE